MTTTARTAAEAMIWEQAEEGFSDVHFCDLAEMRAIEVDDQGDGVTKYTFEDGSWIKYDSEAETITHDLTFIKC